jgi:hypothetical protein
MFTNRIAKYYEPHPMTADRSQTSPASNGRARPTVPAGFAAVPAKFLSTPSSIYEAAYLAAQQSARDRLLELLRSRAGYMRQF